MIHVALIAILLAPSTENLAIVGLWNTPVDASTIRVEPCGEAVCGRLVSSARLKLFPNQTDIRNREPALRSRPVAGLLLLKVRATAPGRWGDGWVYNPKDGGTYRGTVDLGLDGRLHLKGCIVAPLCRNQVWTRAR